MSDTIPVAAEPNGDQVLKVRRSVIYALLCWLTACVCCSRSPSQRRDLAEADEAARKVWASLTIKCGDTWFEEDLANFVELRRFSFTVDSDYLTDLDKQNGYEWKGMTWERTEAWRPFVEGMPQAWRKGSRGYGLPIAKVHGRWIAGREPFLIEVDKLSRSEMRCENFPR